MQPIHIVQISDIHLFADPTKKLRNQNTEQNLIKVLSFIKSNESKLDALLMTGDLADDGSVAAYERLRHHLADFACPIYYLPGNHDDLQDIAQLNTQYISANSLVSFANWDLVLLNSVVPGKEEGLLAETQLALLEQALTQNSKFKLIALHHHAVPIKTKLFAAIDLKNREQFWQIVSKAPHAKLVVSGHVHQAFQGRVGDVAFLTCPATSVQVKPDSQVLDHHDPAFLDSIPPGYRTIQLFADGRFATQVKRVG